MKESNDITEDIATGEEAAEYLCIAAMNPFAAELKRVFSSDQRKVVTNIRPPKEFVDRWLQEKRLPKAE